MFDLRQAEIDVRAVLDGAESALERELALTALMAIEAEKLDRLAADAQRRGLQAEAAQMRGQAAQARAEYRRVRAKVGRLHSEENE